MYFKVKPLIWHDEKVHFVLSVFCCKCTLLQALFH